MAIGQIQNGDKGKPTREKINLAILEADKVASKMDKVPTAPSGANAVFDANGQVIAGALGAIVLDPQDPNPDYLKGLLFYDQLKDALSFFNNSEEITLNLGEELLAPIVKNVTGATIPNGAAVYISGVDSGYYKIDLANAREKTKSRIVYIATMPILNGEIGRVTRFGEVGGLNTSAFYSGDLIYLSLIDGEISHTAPNDGAYLVSIGTVKTVHATTGVILVDSKSSDLTVEITDTNGFPPDQRAATTPTFVDGTRIFTLTPTGAGFHYYLIGDKYEKTTPQSITISNVTGLHAIYFDGATLTELVNGTTADYENIILNKAFVTLIYWNATSSKAILINDERHGISFPPAVHLYLHQTLKAQFISGLALDSIIIGNGSLDSHAQFGTLAGQISDEDLPTVLLPVASTIGLKILYRNGANGYWNYITNAGFSFPVGATPLPQYNLYTGGVWSLAEVTNTNFVLCHIFATADIALKPICVIGSAQYTSIALATAGAPNEISLIGDLPVPEFVLVGSVIIEGKTSLTNSVNARIVAPSSGGSYIDWRTSKISGSASPSDHNLLTNLQTASNGVTFGHINNSIPLQIPELTTVSRDAYVTPRAGMLIYNTTTGEHELYNGTVWRVVLNSLGAAVASATNLNPINSADSFPVSGTTTINAIDSTNWKAGRTIKLQFSDACIITHNGTVAGDNKKIILKKAANYTTLANDILMLWYNGTSWYEVNDLTKVAGGGGSGGHTIKNNAGTTLATEANMTFKTNGIGAEIATDNAGAGSTDISFKILSATDTNPTGIADGNLLKYDLASLKIIPQTTTPFVDILRTSEANLSANGILSSFLPAGYKIDSIIIKNQTANAAGNISVGTAAAGTQIVNMKTVGASAVVDCTLVEDFFSDVNATDLYISSSAWGTGIVTIYFTFKKII